MRYPEQRVRGRRQFRKGLRQDSRRLQCAGAGVQFPGRSIESSRQILSPFSSRPDAMVVHCLRYPLLDWLATDRSLLSNSLHHSLCSCLPSDFARQVACHLDDDGYDGSTKVFFCTAAPAAPMSQYLSFFTFRSTFFSGGKNHNTDMLVI